MADLRAEECGRARVRSDDCSTVMHSERQARLVTHIKRTLMLLINK